MPFERSLEIERRLNDVLRLIRTGRFSTPMLAEKVKHVDPDHFALRHGFACEGARYPGEEA